MDIEREIKVRDAIKYCIENFDSKTATNRIVEFWKDELELQQKQCNIANVSGAVALLKFLKEEQQEYYQKSTGIFDASIHQHYEEALIAVLELINSRFGN